MNRPKKSNAPGEPTEMERVATEEEHEDGFLATLKTIGWAVALAMVIRIFIFEAFEIEGPSMEPTLYNGDRVVVAKFLYGIRLPTTTLASVTWGSPDVGDVVIVTSPDDEVDIVKRVIAVAGDKIEVRDGVIHRNGQAITRVAKGECSDDDDRLDAGTADCVWWQETVGDTTYTVSHDADWQGHPPVMERVVPEGTIFVMGDHRDRSNDSRFSRVDMIDVRRVKGNAWVIYWSGSLPWSDSFRASRIGTVVN